MLALAPARASGGRRNRQPYTPSGHQCGMSIVEMLIAVAIALFVMAGTISLFVTNLGNMRRLGTEARVNQDMRTAMELITRDLRRAGYWANAISGTVAAGVNNVTTANAYAGVTATASQVNYSFARDTDNLLGPSEQFGFRLNAGVVEMQTDATSWQAITNSDLLTVTALTITPVTTALPVGDICMKTCAAGTVSPEGTNCPTLTIRQYRLLLQGRSATDNRIKRELQSSVRIRNDQFDGACPL